MILHIYLILRHFINDRYWWNKTVELVLGGELEVVHNIDMEVLYIFLMNFCLDPDSIL